jgi:23S rRNA maturation mini-RNase III
MAHLKLHTKQRKSGAGERRVTFYEDAVRKFADEKQNEQRRGRNAKLGEPLSK